MPTVCFRGGCLTGPNHAGAHAARLPLLPDALHRHRQAVHGLRLRRQAGARQHPQRRPRARLRRLSPSAARRPRSTTSAAAGRATARCSRRSTLCEQIAGRELDWTLSDEARMGDHRWWISDLSEFQARLPGLGRSSTTSTAMLREIYERERRALDGGAREALGRHPGPQRGGLDRATLSHGLAARSTPRRSTTRCSSSTTRAPTARRGRRAVGERTLASAACARTTAAASASPSARGSTTFEGTRSRS